MTPIAKQIYLFIIISKADYCFADLSEVFQSGDSCFLDFLISIEILAYYLKSLLPSFKE